MTAPSVKCIVLLDLDNWPAFFKRLPFVFPKQVQIGAFARYDTGALHQLNNEERSIMHRLVEKGQLNFFPSIAVKDSADAMMIMKAQEVENMGHSALAILLLSEDGIFKQAQAVLQESGRQVFLSRTHRYSEFVAILEGLCGEQITTLDEARPKKPSRKKAQREARSGGSPGHANGAQPKRGFKTTICRYHAKGGCRKGAGCDFAHGGEELRSPQCSVPEDLEKVTVPMSGMTTSGEDSDFYSADER
ncbi:hypothetical protein CYMTET_35115 [Cymbomonas tetramitiformis]|uniref:C3H1-type domain-containing protein n=1 Tax=Cymbomonas tetramitiformis TaxID=36881 RepID=A0AAE0F9Y0_9CHLO|nr:hypothetical protein CYMTET_35115 [Cymbomonas tetramitiformis]